MVELHATWCEPSFNTPGIRPQEARQKLREWRVDAPADHYRKIKREFDEAGITIFTYYVNIGDADTDAEIDATYTAAKLLGAKGAIGSYGQAVARRLAPFPPRHGIFTGLHNHDNLSDPDAFNTEASFEKGLSYSPDFKATLDVRHFTAANGDCIGFLERHHERVSSVHLGDRRRNNGQTPALSPMPQFSDLSDQQIADLARWIHYARAQGRFKELIEATDAPPGKIAPGKAYFDEKCGSCHSASSDMAGIGRKYKGPQLKALLLKPNVMDEPRSWKLDQLRDVRKAAARQQHQRVLENYSAEEASNLTAYLATLN